MTVKDRLEDYLINKSIKKTHFESSIGAANGFINSIKRSISPEYLEEIANKYPDLNIEWLLIGKGEMLNKYSIGDRNVYSSGLVGGSITTGDNKNNKVYEDTNSQAIIKELELKVESYIKEIEHYKKEINHLERLLEERQTIIDLLKKNN